MLVRACVHGCLRACVLACACACALACVQVGMSLLSLVVTDEPTGVVRVMRALRVLRIFGRLPSLRKVLLFFS